MVVSGLCGFVILHRKADRLSKIFDLTLVLSFVMFTLSMLYLIYAFLVTDTCPAYVWSNSSVDLEVVYKPSGIWSGLQRSFMLLTWLMSLVIVLELYRERRANSDRADFSIRLRTVAITVTAIFAIVLLTVKHIRTERSVLGVPVS